jgi:hypothetical protein
MNYQKLFYISGSVFFILSSAIIVAMFGLRTFD